MKWTLSRWKRRCRLFWERSLLHRGDPLRRKIADVGHLFLDVDRDTRAFSRDLGVACPDRCGACCGNAHVQASELEMLPLADDLIRRKVVDQYYELADKLDFQGRCVFFVPDAGGLGQGHCSQYAFRPLICRLFGFSGNNDKYGEFRLVACAVLKDRDLQAALERKKNQSGQALKTVNMSDYSRRLAGIDPDLTRDMLPNNLAFKRAVDRIWLHQKFSR